MSANPAVLLSRTGKLAREQFGTRGYRYRNGNRIVPSRMAKW
jgi:hypothetical protein